MDTNWENNKFITLPRKVVESWDWAQNVCIDEMNNFVEDEFPVIPLVFKIIDIIELIESQYLVIVPKY